MIVAVATLLSAVCAAGAGFAVGGALGYGLACGGFLGAAVGAATSLYLMRVAREAPQRVFNAFVLGFLAKLGVLMVGGLAFIVYEPLRERLDPRSFLLACAATALVGLMAGIAAARTELRDGARRTETRP